MEGLDAVLEALNAAVVADAEIHAPAHGLIATLE
jgi:hypothetical protein